MTIKHLSACLTGALAVFFVTYNWFFAVNFPYQDDFLLIQFIETVSGGNYGIAAFVKELFRTFNDHKAVVPRLIAFTDYVLTGHLHFRFYILLTSLNIIGIFGFLYIQFKKTRLPEQYFLPVPFLFFNPLYHDISGWALNGMQHSFLTVFTVTAIFLVSFRTTITFLSGVACCFLATFTHGNGILSFPAIILYFICIKDFRRAAMAVGLMFLCLGIYVAGYESGQAVNLPTSAMTFLISFFGLIGSQMSLWSNPQFWSVVWGMLIVGFMLYGLSAMIFTQSGPLKWIKSPSAELLTLLAFIVATSFVIALFRSWAGSTLASRFQLYAALSTTVFYILLLDWFPFFRKKSVLYVVTILSVFYAASSYHRFTGTVATKKTTYLADIYNWTTNRGMFSVERSIVQNAGFYLMPAYAKGFFRLQEPVVDQGELDSMFAVTNLAEKASGVYLEPWHMRRLSRDNAEDLTHYFISSSTFPGPKELMGNRFLALKETIKGTTYLMSANPKVGARRRFLTEGNYYENGFNVFLRADDLAPGTYSLAILDVKIRGERVFNRLDKTLLAADGRYALE
jgi:hypothetical protein